MLRKAHMQFMRFGTNAQNWLKLSINRQQVASLCIPFSERSVHFYFKNGTVQDAAKSIEKEHADSEVKFLTSQEELVPLSMEFSQLMTSDFKLKLKQKVYDVKVSSTLVESPYDISSLMLKAAVMQVKKRLSGITRDQLSVKEFEKICEEYGVSKTECSSVLKILHQSADVFYFEKTDKDIVFLNPESIVDKYFAQLGFKTPTMQMIMKDTETLVAEKRNLDKEFAAMTKFKAELDANSTIIANRWCYAASSVLVGTFGFYWWLTFVHLSWDIMEPVTYFTAFGVSIGSYCWWSFTSKEYEYENVYDFIFQWHSRKLYLQKGFSMVDYANVQRLLSVNAKRVLTLEHIQNESSTIQATLYQEYLQANKIEQHRWLPRLLSLQGRDYLQ